MKLTVIKDEDKKNEIVPDISRFANTQNKVSDLDLSSNNPLLQRLEELSRTTYGKDKEDSNKHTLWFFERVKGQYRETLNKEPTKGKQDAFKLKFPRNQFIIKSEVAKYMNVWKQLPYQVAKGSQKNYNIYLPEVEKEFKKDKLGRTYWQDIVANAILFRTADKLFGRKNQNPIGDTNIKSITVIYSLSLIHYLTNNKINLGEIWEEQEVSIEFQTLLTITLKYTYNFLINLDVALISEAAKSEKTWKSLKERTDYPIQFADFESWIISEEDFKKRYESKNDDVEEAKKYKNSQKIFSHGIKFWDGLEKYTETTKILSQYQENFANKIKKKLINSGTLTDVEIRKGVEIIDMINELEIDFDSIINLSKYKEIELVDPSLLYNRFQNINDEDWKRIIDLGEQTGTLSFNEICVIKSAIKKLKAKENLDIKRMKTVEDALQKVSKFGIKI